jgi:hypothetical protein
MVSLGRFTPLFGSFSIGISSLERQQPLEETLRSPELGSNSSVGDSLAFGPDGKLLVSATERDRILLWNLDPTSWEDEACRVANRNLTLAEWRRYVGADVAYRVTCPGLPPGEGVTTRNGAEPSDGPAHANP